MIIKLNTIDLEISDLVKKHLLYIKKDLCFFCGLPKNSIHGSLAHHDFHYLISLYVKNESLLKVLTKIFPRTCLIHEKFCTVDIERKTDGDIIKEIIQDIDKCYKLGRFNENKIKI